MRTSFLTLKDKAPGWLCSRQNTLQDDLRKLENTSRAIQEEIEAINHALTLQSEEVSDD